MVKSSSLQPWRLWSICWTLPIEIDQTISNQPHYPSGETIFLFSKVSAECLQSDCDSGPTGLYSPSLRLYAVSLFLFLGATKVWCLETRKRDEKSFNLEIPEDICRMRYTVYSLRSDPRFQDPICNEMQSARRLFQIVPHDVPMKQRIHKHHQFSFKHTTK